MCVKYLTVQDIICIFDSEVTTAGNFPPHRRYLGDWTFQDIQYLVSDRFAARNPSPANHALCLERFWFVVVKQRNQEHHKIPCLKWQMRVRLSEARPGHGGGKKQNSRLCWILYGWLPCTQLCLRMSYDHSEKLWQRPPPTWPSSHFGFFHPVVAVCLHCAINKILSGGAGRVLRSKSFERETLEHNICVLGFVARVLKLLFLNF